MKHPKNKTRKPIKKTKKQTRKNLWKEGPIHKFISSAQKTKTVLKELDKLKVFDIKKQQDLYVPPSNQRNSGRCWMFSYLNLLRLSLISKYKLKPTFSLSASYMTLWDKYEKCNYFLHKVSKYSNLSMDDIQNHLLFRNMISDGGTWNMIQNIVSKYGVVPYESMKESYHTVKTSEMNDILFKILQQSSKQIRSLSKEKHEAIIKSQMKSIYAFLVKCIGKPPKKVCSLKLSCKKEYTPKEFYETEIKPISGNDVDTKVVLINVPHLEENQYYTIPELNNMLHGKKMYYFNVSLKTMKTHIVKQILDKKGVWFGCDFDNFHYKDESLLDNKVFSYDTFIFKKKELHLPKENALPYYQTNVNHAMVFNGFYYKPSSIKKPLYWNVENSHDSRMKSLSFEDSHGHMVMSDTWFDSFVVMAVVDEMYFENDTLTSKIRDKDNVIELPKWSNLGELLFS